MTSRPAPMRLRDMADELPKGLREALEESALRQLPTAQELLELETRLQDQLAMPNAGDPAAGRRGATVHRLSAKLAVVPLLAALAGAAALWSNAKQTPPMATAHVTAHDQAPAPLAVAPVSEASGNATATSPTADVQARAVERRAKDEPGEVELLAHARQVVDRNPELAQRLVREHERRFADGLLVEEREAIAVQALTRAGSLGQARARATRFFARFPDSAYASSVASVLEQATNAAERLPKK